MTWQRIDDDTYIDDTLVTCAEYQLFIDEMREQGKYYQPDHWTSYQYSKREAKKPILGVRELDAFDFCRWLTSREKNEWRFELPTLRHVVSFPLKLSLMPVVGYWLLDHPNFNWVDKVPNKILDHVVSRSLQIDTKIGSLVEKHIVARDPKMDLSETLRIISDFGGDLSRDFSIESNELLEIKNDVVLVRKLAKDVLVATTRHPKVDITLAIDISLNLISILKKIDSALRGRLSNIARDVIDNNSMSTVISNDRRRTKILDLSLLISLTYGLNLLIDLFILIDRIEGHSPAFEGIRLVKERIK